MEEGRGQKGRRTDGVGRVLSQVFLHSPSVSVVAA